MRLAHLHPRGCAAAALCLLVMLALGVPAAAQTPSERSAAQSTTQGSARSADRSGPLVPGHPTWPENPQVLLRPRDAADDSSSSGFDWGAAGIGAAGTAVLVGVTLGGISVMVRRRRRPARSPSLAP